MSTDKNEKEAGLVETEAETQKNEVETELKVEPPEDEFDEEEEEEKEEDEENDDDEEDDEDDEDDEDEFEMDIETEIEHQTPEVIAKELLITYLEGNALPYPDAGENESRYQAIGRAIGEMYNALLDEIRKKAE